MFRIVVLCFILLFFRVGFSQSETYKFTHITTADGLSQSSVIVIRQDNLGQIWVGTRDGLNKYDGTDFTVYRYDKNNPYSISNNDILSIEQDSDGFIWVGTNLGLNKYNPQKNTFKTYFSNKNNYSLKDNSVGVIKELSNKEIWIGTNQGISIYDKSKDSFKKNLIYGQVLSILETNKGDVFVGTTSGLWKLVDTTNNDYQFELIKGTNNLIIQCIIENKNGNLLIGTRKESVLEFNVDTNNITAYFKEETLENKNRNVRQLLLDGDSKLWIGTYNGIQIADKSKNIQLLTSNINDNESINDNFIKALFKDKNGSIWVGTYHGGINVWDESNINFINITQKPGNIGLGYKVVSSIVSHKNFIFLGTEGGGISVINTNTKKINYITAKNTLALRSNNVKSLYLSRENLLWIGTFTNGFAVYNIETKRFINMQLPKTLREYMGNVGIYDIKQDNNGNMLLGTNGKGLIKYNINDKSYKIFANNKKSNSLSNIIIRTIKVDTKNNIWLGTPKGLNYIDDTTGSIKKYFFDSELKTGYAITSVYEDSKGVIWVGTIANGLFKLVDNTFTSIDLKSNTTTIAGIRSMIEDDNGSFWISSVNQGIINYNPTNNSIVAHYTQKEGLASNQFNNNASLRIGDNLFFGGPAGAVFFNPKNLLKNNYVPQVIITDLKIKNKSISVDDDSQLLSRTISYTKNIELSHEEGNFNISFSIPNFINSSSNRYKYRLKGLENDWIETDEHSASYTIQNPGNYIFEVKGINSDGISNDVATSLNIKVHPAPWRTWWAFILYGIVLFAIFYYLLNILKSRTKLKHQLDLEHLEVEQTKQTNIAKLEFFTNISHEFRTPLTLILGPLNQILENYKGSSLMYKKLKVIESSANHLLQLINRLMDFRKLESNLIKLETAEGNIVKFLKEIYLSFSEYAKDGNYDYSFHSPSDEIYVYYDRYKLERVFYNLISNAFRYTPKNGKIVLRVIQKPHKIILQVEDSGVGVAKEYQDKIFERFFELSLNNKPDNDYNKGTGIGLSIVKNIIDLHKGEIKVRNNENNKGSIFSVELLLGRDHINDDEIIEDFKFSDDLSQYVNQLDETPVILEENNILDHVSEEKLTILLVEDNKPLRKFMRTLLAKEYNILEAENGKVAYKIAIKEKIDIIVSDVVMPIMTGTELCSLVKKDIKTSHIPIILLTSRSSLIYKLEGLETGADDYISKPFNINEFKLRIKNILSSIARLKQKINSINTVQSDELILPSLDEKLYKKALKLVEKNISNEEFDIYYFCSELGVSRTVLFRKVKAWTDFTPKDFIQHIRLKKGAELLEQNKMNIAQVSYKVGFKNPKYFSKCFRKKFGKTPTEYIKTFCEYE
ncbi:two-component regulator propeller domain-containing protein [Polaribacter butkevichii]|uniref:histidine kinase n=1 Tax=Polaribacter butkevichii TaxID=218490 RepID=A0A2P6CA42_9FLAO|nr:two-component regulator propeller domain-containing protein [Polaribacter butkevichii]PQJ71728.1 hybrid sensor histidine kinase/response regulator [Polaribacter butkevichii]